MAKILIVEDNEDTRMVYGTILRHFGFEVVEATDGRTGIEVARQVLPDLITMDLSLPYIDGLEATKMLRADDQTRGIPIIALTGHSLTADRAKAVEIGFDGYLVKPVEPPRLIQEVKRLLELAESPEALLSARESGEFMVVARDGVSADILLVEDNEQSRREYGTVLRDHGFAVAEATNGETAVRLAREIRPDLVLMDITLPKMDGWEAARIILSENEGSVQIIALMTNGSFEARFRVLREGLSGHLQKPIDPTQLIQMVQRQLSQLYDLRARKQQEPQVDPALRNSGAWLTVRPEKQLARGEHEEIPSAVLDGIRSGYSRIRLDLQQVGQLHPTAVELLFELQQMVESAGRQYVIIPSDGVLAQLSELGHTSRLPVFPPQKTNRRP